MSKVVRARYEGGVLKPLERLDLEEGEEVQVVLKASGDSLVRKLYGVAKKRRPSLTRSDFLEVVEEIEDEDIRGL